MPSTRRKIHIDGIAATVCSYNACSQGLALGSKVADRRPLQFYPKDEADLLKWQAAIVRCISVTNQRQIESEQRVKVTVATHVDG